ncbi:Ethyl tert-butyl ether degradation EthD [Beutenbergia cavernae DSM 12333]|uniref:Ethyl tert-butyl ether degradation EthD n=1 Tax=Beutenbergia cavernae (strain ATCC BAA-8 / DSM 12333 / CCUG 43141 / JCM 11478 / NBRC 16432 / NCIMB 13614 / HKI 0122) TaxID=471853 RepID=C5C4B3_BEUC1|nr:EthD family reductase [Beutenbergia cavernae]ACQ82037.1 Ethyl tert-butyl ether degradation EthD [Beutenbergia cavernae DSM 12333]
MYRVSVVYGAPDDPQAFDDYYERVHIPLASKIPGLTRWTLTRADRTDGPLPDAYLIADLYAESRDALTAALASPEGRAAADDVAVFATGGATMVFGDEVEVSLP